jgi:hypothetical protein
VGRLGAGTRKISRRVVEACDPDPPRAYPSRLRCELLRPLAIALSRSVLKISDVHEFAERRDRSIILPQAVTQ